MTLEKELQIVESAKSNINDFAKIYDYYFSKIYAYCLNRLSSKEMAEDVVSYVFMKAVEEVKKFNTAKKVRFSSWLYRTAQNRIIDTYRSNSKRQTDELFDDDVSDDSDIEEHVTRHQRQKEISATLDELNKRYQQVISLRFFSELELEEIAEIMEISKNNVSVLLNRALASFKKVFEEKFPESESFTI